MKFDIYIFFHQAKNGKIILRDRGKKVKYIRN